MHTAYTMYIIYSKLSNKTFNLWDNTVRFLEALLFHEDNLKSILWGLFNPFSIWKNLWIIPKCRVSWSWTKSFVIWDHAIMEIGSKWETILVYNATCCGYLQLKYFVMCVCFTLYHGQRETDRWHFKYFTRKSPWPGNQVPWQFFDFPHFFRWWCCQ